MQLIGIRFCCVGCAETLGGALEAVVEERFRQLELRLNIQEKSGRALLDTLIAQQSSMKQQVMHIEAALSAQRQVCAMCTSRQVHQIQH